MQDPWSWLLGRTAAGAWRHVPHQAQQLGQGQDPSQEPRVEVIRRLIAYPSRAFAAVVEAVAALDRPDQPVRWLCYRDPGASPARPYWLCFVTAREDGRRFHVGIELFDRARLGLWFFSGFAADAVPAALQAPFPARPEVSLPRLELGDADVAGRPVARWIAEAWRDALRFDGPGGSSARPSDESAEVDATITSARAPKVDGRHYHDVSLRASRARLVSFIPMSESGDPDEPIEQRVRLHPLCRLSTVIGRDPRCDLALDHRNISAEHCRLTWRDGIPVVEDLGSKNGTKVEGKPVGPGEALPLPPEARIELGTVLCLFVQDLPEPSEGPRRHQERVEALVASGRLSAADARSVYDEAERRGVTPGEVLLLRGALALADWAPPRGGGCGGLAGLLLLLAPLLLLAGCTSFAIPPLYEQDLDPAPQREAQRRVEWDFDIGLRPLFQARADAETQRAEGHLLFPLGYMQQERDEKLLRMYPIYQRIVRTDPDGFQDDDTLVFPLLATGHHPVEGSYLYVFPFGGTLKGLLGKDEALGVLFPLYGWTRRGETESHHILFPLISLTYGGGVSGFRFLPFYGHLEKRRPDGELVFNRTTVLWPLISWAAENTNSRNPFRSLVVFPFFGFTRSEWMDDTTILWPFFRWWEDKRTGYQEYRLPFPFLIFGSGPEQSRFDLWPLFGFRERGSYRRHFFLWPIERYETIETEEYVDRRLWVLPFFWGHHRRYKQGLDGAPPGEDVQVNVWPLLRYEERRDGTFEVAFPAPLWFEDPTFNFDAILGPLWRLFRYRREADGRTRLDVLLGLFSARSGPEEERWDVLGGLVGRTTRADGTSTTRLLWALEF